MYRRFADGEAGLFQRLAHDRVRVDGAAEVLGAAAVFHVRDNLADQLAGAMAENLRAEDPVGLGGGNDLHEAIGGVGGDGTAVGGEVELADVDRAIRGLGGILAEAYPRDLGFGIDDGRNEIPIDMAGLASDPLGDRRAVLLGLVCEHRAGDDVADGPHAGGGGPELGINLDAPLGGELHAGLFHAGPVRVRAGAGR